MSLDTTVTTAGEAATDREVVLEDRSEIRPRHLNHTNQVSLLQIVR